MATARTKTQHIGTGQTSGAVNADLITYAVPASSVVHLDACFIGKAGDGDGKCIRRGGIAVRNVAGTVTEIGTSLAGSAFYNHEDADLSGSATTPVISGTNLVFRVTGVAGQTIDWIAYVTAAVN